MSLTSLMSLRSTHAVPFEEVLPPPLPFAAEPAAPAAEATVAPPHGAFPSPDLAAARRASAEAPPAAGATRSGVALGWTSMLLGEGRIGLAADGRRLAVGLGLAATYGLALGTRHGSRALLTHAVGVPAGLLAVTALGAPALYLGLALFDAPIELPRFFSATARAVARSGVVMAGLAPAAALYVVSSEGAGAAATAGAFGLFVGGLLGLSALVHELRVELRKASATTQLVSLTALAAFGVFALALSMRVWGALPLLRGGR